MLGNPGLRQVENGLQVAHTQRPPSEKVNDPQTGAVAETFIDADQGHGRSVEWPMIFVNMNIRFGE